MPDTGQSLSFMSTNGVVVVNVSYSALQVYSIKPKHVRFLLA